MMPDDDLADLAADERAALAVLDMALAERFTGAHPPSLWPRVQAASAAARPRRGWLVAALLLLALGAVATFAVTAARSTAPAQAPAEDWPDGVRSPSGPSTLEELRQRLAPVTKTSLRARGSWLAGSGTWLPWQRLPLDDLFRPTMTPELEPAVVPSLVAALRAEALAPTDRAPVVWTHELVLVAGNDVLFVLLQTGGPTPPRLAWRSPRGAVELTTQHVPFAQLQAQLAEVSRATIAGLGLVLGADGFAAVPESSRRLRLVDVPAAAVEQLARYRDARQLDLIGSPAWHATAVLRQLPSTIEGLTVAPSRLAADAWPVLGALGNLRELFLVGDGPFAVMLGAAAVTSAPTLDDAALTALSGLTRLQELALAGGSFTDQGLLALAALPLQRLALLGCPRVHGRTLGSLPSLAALLLRGEGFDRDVLAQTSRLPALHELTVFAPRTAIALDALPGLPKLDHLTLDTATPREELAALARCAGLHHLGLRLAPPLRDDELHLLTACSQLRILKIPGDGVTAAGRARLKQALPRCSIGDELW